MGCNYVFGWIIVLPLEITAAGIIVSHWLNKSAGHPLLRAFFSKPSDYPPLKDNRLQLATVAINAFGTLGYEEFCSSCLKIFVIVMFILSPSSCARRCQRDREHVLAYHGHRYPQLVAYRPQPAVL